MAVVSTTTTSPLGFFVGSPGAQADPTPLLCDNIDPQTLDFASLFTGANPIDSQVAIALGTVRGTGAAVTEVGMAPLPGKIDAQFEARIASDVQFALRRLIRNRDISLVSVTLDLDEANQFVSVAVRFINLRAMDGNERVLQLPILTPGV